MNAPGIQDREKVRKELAKKAVALAMKSRWEEAANVNRAVINDFPDDLEAYNRLGKALSELGQNREAIEAFQNALNISPHNGIAKKNLDRLMRLGEGEAVQPASRSRSAPQVFIEESGKTSVTSLINLPPSKVILKLAPGHSLKLEIRGNGLKVTTDSGEYIGQVEPRLASRVVRLMKGGNRYETAVTSITPKEVLIIIREVYKHPSQAGIVSFPSRSGGGYRTYVPGGVLDYDLGDAEDDESGRELVKDWSNDDTEPGDDEAFTPVFHRIINSDSSDEASDDDY